MYEVLQTPFAYINKLTWVGTPTTTLSPLIYVYNMYMLSRDMEFLCGRKMHPLGICLGFYCTSTKALMRYFSPIFHTSFEGQISFYLIEFVLSKKVIVSNGKYTKIITLQMILINVNRWYQHYFPLESFWISPWEYIIVCSLTQCNVYIISNYSLQGWMSEQNLGLVYRISTYFIY